MRFGLPWSGKKSCGKLASKCYLLNGWMKMDVKRHYYVTTGNDYNGKYKCELNQIIIMKNNHPSLNTSCSDDGAKELIEVMNE